MLMTPRGTDLVQMRRVSGHQVVKVVSGARRQVTIAASDDVEPTPRCPDVSPAAEGRAHGP